MKCSYAISSLLCVLALLFNMANTLAIPSEPARLFQEDAISGGQFSPDGRYWVYITNQNNQPGYNIISLSTDTDSTRIDLTDASVDHSQFIGRTNIHISPDSQWIIFSLRTGKGKSYINSNGVFRQAGNILFSVPIDGSRPPIRLTLPQHELEHAAQQGHIRATISDDSQWVVFQAGADFSNGRVYTVAIDGSKPAINMTEDLKQTVSKWGRYQVGRAGFLPGSNQLYLEYFLEEFDLQAQQSKVTKYWFKRPANADQKAKFLFPEQASLDTEITIYAYGNTSKWPENTGTGDQWLYTISHKPEQSTSPELGFFQGTSIIQFDPATGQKTVLPTGLDAQTRFRINKVKGQWIIYSTAEKSYVINQSQPRQQRTLSNHPRIFNNVVDILLNRQSIAYTTLELDPGSNNSGIERLYLQSLSDQKPAVLLAEGPWKLDGVLFSRILSPGFWFTTDEQWLIATGVQKNNSFGTQLINLDQPKSPRELNHPHLQASLSLFSPSANRIVQIHPIDPIPGHVMDFYDRYDPLILDPGTNIQVNSKHDLSFRVSPDNCQAFLTQRAAQKTTIYKTECDRPFTELWWNPEFSGQGLRVQQTRDRIFAVWFSYGSRGQANWLTLSGQLVNNRLHGELKQFTGSALGQIWQSGQIQGKTVGTATLTLGEDRTSAHFSYTRGSVSGALSLEPFYPGPRNLYDGFWWQPDTSGQGMQLYRKGNTLFGTLYLYDESGENLWVTFQGELNARSSTFKAALNRFTGPKLGTEWNVDQVKGNIVGKISLKFDTSSFIRMDAEINGKPIHLNLLPFQF